MNHNLAKFFGYSTLCNVLQRYPPTRPADAVGIDDTMSEFSEFRRILAVPLMETGERPR
jgi:hypothetical protein